MLDRSRVSIPLFVLTMGITGLVVGACGSDQSSEPTLSAADVVGTWSGSEGTMTFLANRTFESHDLNLNAAFGSGCPRVSGTGTWQFEGDEGTGSNSRSYKRGHLIFVAFGGSLTSCNFQLTSWEVDPPVALCIFSDPDSPCSSPVFTLQSKRDSGQISG